MNQPKKRLQLAPEMLPTPQRSDPNRPSVRERTIARLKILAALSTATFTGIGAACSGGTGSGPGGSGDGGDAGNDGPSREECDPYCVVDPLPPPTCFDKSEGVRQQLTATASYLGAPDAGDDAGDAGSNDAGDAGPSRRRFEVVVGFESPVAGLVLGMTTGSQRVIVESADLSMTSIRVVAGVVDDMGLPGSETIQIELSCTKGPTSVSVQLQFGPSTIVANAYAR